MAFLTTICQLSSMDGVTGLTQDHPEGRARAAAAATLVGRVADASVKSTDARPVVETWMDCVVSVCHCQRCQRQARKRRSHYDIDTSDGSAAVSATSQSGRPAARPSAVAVLVAAASRRRLSLVNLSSATVAVVRDTERRLGFARLTDWRTDGRTYSVTTDCRNRCLHGEVSTRWFRSGQAGNWMSIRNETCEIVLGQTCNWSTRSSPRAVEILFEIPARPTASFDWLRIAERTSALQGLDVEPTSDETMTRFRALNGVTAWLTGDVN